MRPPPAVSAASLGLFGRVGTAAADGRAGGVRPVAGRQRVEQPSRDGCAPDGRLFVTLQNGTVRVVKDGAMLPTPFATVNEDSAGGGLLGITFDPDFATNQYVYVYYTKDDPAPLVSHKVSRFVANGDVAVPGSETVLFLPDVGKRHLAHGRGVALRPRREATSRSATTSSARPRNRWTHRRERSCASTRTARSRPTTRSTRRRRASTGPSGPTACATPSPCPAGHGTVLHQRRRGGLVGRGERGGGRQELWLARDRGGVQPVAVPQLHQPDLHLPPQRRRVRGRGVSGNASRLNFPAQYTASTFGDFGSGWVRTIDPATRRLPVRHGLPVPGRPDAHAGREPGC